MRIATLQKTTPSKNKSNPRQKIVLKTRIKPFFNNLFLTEPGKTFNFQLKYVSSYGEKDGELMKRYNISENVEYSVVKIHEFGLKRLVVIRDGKNNQGVMRFLDLDQVCRVFNVLIANGAVDIGADSGVRVVCDWIKV